MPLWRGEQIALDDPGLSHGEYGAAGLAEQAAAWAFESRRGVAQAAELAVGVSDQVLGGTGVARWNRTAGGGPPAREAGMEPERAA
jgi:hypothetical protein